MPTVLRWAGYRFYIFSNEGFEPPHVPVDKEGKTAKFWLNPVVSVARNGGFSSGELRTIETKLVEERERFIEAWNGAIRPPL